MLVEILILIVLFLILNIIWEYSHSGLYDWNTAPLRNDKKFKFIRLVQSICGDVFILSLIFLGVIFLRGRELIIEPIGIDYLIVLFTGLIIAYGVERYSVGKRWNYLDRMPKIFGVGISPLIQLGITGALSMLLFDFFY